MGDGCAINGVKILRIVPCRTIAGSLSERETHLRVQRERSRSHTLSGSPSLLQERRRVLGRVNSQGPKRGCVDHVTIGTLQLQLAPILPRRISSRSPCSEKETATKAYAYHDSGVLGEGVSKQEERPRASLAPRGSSGTAEPAVAWSERLSLPLFLSLSLSLAT